MGLLTLHQTWGEKTERSQGNIRSVASVLLWPKVEVLPPPRWRVPVKCWAEHLRQCNWPALCPTPPVGKEESTLTFLPFRSVIYKHFVGLPYLEDKFGFLWKAIADVDTNGARQDSQDQSQDDATVRHSTQVGEAVAVNEEQQGNHTQCHQCREGRHHDAEMEGSQSRTSDYKESSLLNTKKCHRFPAPHRLSLVIYFLLSKLLEEFNGIQI